MQTTPTSIRLPEDDLRQLDALASAQGRSRTYLLQKAVRQYLEYETWFVQAVEQAQTSAASGQVLSTEDVRARLALAKESVLAKRPVRGKRR